MEKGRNNAGGLAQNNMHHSIQIYINENQIKDIFYSFSEENDNSGAYFQNMLVLL